MPFASTLAKYRVPDSSFFLTRQSPSLWLLTIATFWLLSPSQVKSDTVRVVKQAAEDDSRVPAAPDVFRVSISTLVLIFLPATAGVVAPAASASARTAVGAISQRVPIRSLPFLVVLT